jgi:glycosyltransferase involved in cell wall biosynthesis
MLVYQAPMVNKISHMETIKKKKKILVLSDHALCTSGVGVQTRHLIEGLLNKYPGEWTFRQFGAAIKHDNYNTIVVNDDFIVKPIDGFGNPDLLRVTLATERPDILFLFTDPRFFIWLFEMEDEIHQICPIVWWHVWDNYPVPKFNAPLYEATDAINCHSYLTYEMCSENFAEKTNFIPHSVPSQMFYPLPDKEITRHRQELLGPNKLDHFVLLWINRNARRKRPSDLLWAWSLFLEKLEKKTGHKKATLLLHTDPLDNEGPNLFSVCDHFGIRDSVVFSSERIEFEQMNIMHNISDCCINVSYAEGFGLPTLESMQCGNPIIATKTGGLTRQVVDHRDQSENGKAIDVTFTTMVGSQQVPYIYEDYTSVESIADAIFEMAAHSPEAIKALGEKARKYVLEEFAHEKTIDLWHTSLTETLERYQQEYKSWEMKTL